MWYRLINGKVVEIFGTDRPELHPTLMLSVMDLPEGAVVGDLWDGSEFSTPLLRSKLDGGPREPTSEEIVSAGDIGLNYLKNKLNEHIESELFFRGYEKGRASLGLYANTPGRFQEEATALSIWVVSIYEVAEDNQGSEIDWPTLLNLLPQPPARRI